MSRRRPGARNRECHEGQGHGVSASKRGAWDGSMGHDEWRGRESLPATPMEGQASTEHASGPGGYTRGAQVGERSGWVHRALALSLGQVALGWGARRRGSWGGSATHLSLQGGQRGAGERAGRGRSMFSVVGRRRGRARGAGRGAVGFRPGRA